MMRPPPSPTLFPYTPLFRSDASLPRERGDVHTRLEADPQPHRRQRRVAGIGGVVTRRVDVRTPRLRGREAERSEEHTSEPQSQSNFVCRLLLEKKNAHAIAH